MTVRTQNFLSMLYHFVCIVRSGLSAYLLIRWSRVRISPVLPVYKGLQQCSPFSFKYTPLAQKSATLYAVVYVRSLKSATPLMQQPMVGAINVTSTSITFRSCSSSTLACNMPFQRTVLRVHCTCKW